MLVRLVVLISKLRNAKQHKIFNTFKAEPVQPFFMELQQQFETAIAKSKELTKRPSNEELLLLYALFKQGSEGDVSGDRPGGFDFKAIAKFDAWADLKGKAKETAINEYITLVDKLHQLYA
jgi:diazepam-binding inhibitor (GABA receptor modulator, acyl-CoA-binding protein)